MSKVKARGGRDPDGRQRRQSEGRRGHPHHQPENAPKHMSSSHRVRNRELTRKIFMNGYYSYLKNAAPLPQLNPKTCSPTGFEPCQIPYLTMIDGMSTLAVMGEWTEVLRAVERLRDAARKSSNGALFNIDENVSVFETNIRVLGGLLGAHILLMEEWEGGTILNGDIFSYGKVDSEGTRKRKGVLVDKDWGGVSSRGDVIELISEGDDDGGGGGDVGGGGGGDDDDAHYDRDESKTASNTTLHYRAAPPSSFLRFGICDEMTVSVSDFETKLTNNCIFSDVRDDTASVRARDRRQKRRKRLQRLRELQVEHNVYHYDGYLLTLALDLGHRLKFAFYVPSNAGYNSRTPLSQRSYKNEKTTSTGIPYGTVNLRRGVPVGETTISR